MEALTISAANLDTIEKNLGAVANELTGVITNVSTVNNQVNKVEAKVESLNDEIKNLMREIRETTIVTNARQAIMYNNEQINKKYGYYDQVRRTTESLLDALDNSSINKKSLINLKQNLLLNTPNYWLANALAALTSWLLNNKEETDKEVKNALKKDAAKTSLFFTLINLKLGRTTTSHNWLNKYLSLENPLKLDKDFVTILDLVTTGAFGDTAKEEVLTKINTWLNELNSENQIQEKVQNIWFNYITGKELDNVPFNQLIKYSKDINILRTNLILSSSYVPIKNELTELINKDSNSKNINDILNNLIYEYEEKEQTYQKDNLLNQLIINCNGNKEEAQRLYAKQETVLNNQNDIITLLTNIILNKELYKVSEETKKIALAYTKTYLIKALEQKKKQINNDPFNITINDFQTKTTDGQNMTYIKSELELYLSNKFNNEDKDLIIILLFVNIIGIIGIFITLNSKILSTILIIILLLGNIVLFYKLNKRSKIRNIEKNKLRSDTINALERILAESIDYHNIQKEDEEEYHKLINFLNNIEVRNYLNSNNERNINIGE